MILIRLLQNLFNDAGGTSFQSCSGDFQESTSSFLEDSEVYQHGEEF